MKKRVIKLTPDIGITFKLRRSSTTESTPSSSSGETPETECKIDSIFWVPRPYLYIYPWGSGEGGVMAPGLYEFNYQQPSLGHLNGEAPSPWSNVDTMQYIGVAWGECACGVKWEWSLDQTTAADGSPVNDYLKIEQVGGNLLVTVGLLPEATNEIPLWELTITATAKCPDGDVKGPIKLVFRKMLG